MRSNFQFTNIISSYINYSDDEQDRILWVQAIYRATGQSHKPVPPTQVHKLSDKHTKQGQMDAPISQFCMCVCTL